MCTKVGEVMFSGPVEHTTEIGGAAEVRALLLEPKIARTPNQPGSGRVASITWSPATRPPPDVRCIIEAPLPEGRSGSAPVTTPMEVRMKRTALFVIGILAVSIVSLAQGRGGRGAPPPPPLEPGVSQADVDKALIAAPGSQRDQATVIKWKPDFTYEILRKGTNRLVCYDRSGFPLQQPFSVQCTSIGNLDRVAQNLKAESTGDRTKSEAILTAAEKEGTRVKPEYGSLWYNVAGPDQEHARPHHLMIAVPGATTETTGLPENPRQGGAWIMNAGTTTAHIMIPGQ